MKHLFTTALLLAASITGMQAKEAYFKDWKANDPTASIITPEGLVSDDGNITLYCEQGTGEKAPEMFYSNVKVYPGNIFRIKAADGYAITRITTAAGMKRTVVTPGQWGHIFQDHELYPEDYNSGPRWVRTDGSDITEVTIVPQESEFEKNGSAYLSGALCVGYTEIGSSSTVDGYYMFPRTGNNMPSNVNWKLITTDPESVIRYEVYEYTEGMEEPDVTEDSPIFDPENSAIFRNLPFLGVESSKIKVAARAFTPGKKPGDISRSSVVTLAPTARTCAELIEAANGNSPAKQRTVYAGNATVVAVVPGYYYSEAQGTTTLSQRRDIIYLKDETGLFKFEQSHPDISEPFKTFKPGDVITNLCGQLNYSNYSTVPTFVGSLNSGPTFALAEKTDVEPVPFENLAIMDYKEFKAAPMNSLVTLRNVTRNAKYIYKNSFIMGDRYSSDENGCQIKVAGDPKDYNPTNGTDIKIIPYDGTPVDVCGIKTGKCDLLLIDWDVAKPLKATVASFAETKDLSTGTEFTFSTPVHVALSFDNELYLVDNEGGGRMVTLPNSKSYSRGDVIEGFNGKVTTEITSAKLIPATSDFAVEEGTVEVPAVALSDINEKYDWRLVKISSVTINEEEGMFTLSGISAARSLAEGDFLLDNHFNLENIPTGRNVEMEAVVTPTYNGVRKIAPVNITVLSDISTGVQAIETVKARFNVYAVDGRAVMTDASSESLSRLPKGLYIVNGKKLIVR